MTLGKDQGLSEEKLVEEIVVASSDGRRLYAVAGEIYKSYDGGDSWDYVPMSLPDLKLLALMVDPSNADIIYIGTRSLSNEGGLS